MNGSLRAQGKPLLTAVGDFRNPVEGHGWRAAAITSDGEHVLGASDVRAANVIFAWSRFGKRQLDVIIEGAPPAQQPGLAYLHPMHGQKLALCWNAGVQ